MTEGFRQIREQALEEAPNRGREIIDNSATMTAFAADTSDYGLDIREQLNEIASTDIQKEAARMIDYEVTENARRAGLDRIDESEGQIDIAGPLVSGENWHDSLYRAFVLVDRVQKGYTDVRPDSPFEGDNYAEANRFPDPTKPQSFEKDQMAAMDESDDVAADGLGSLNLNGVYVVNDDWIAYRNGNPPPSVDEENREQVYETLRDIGVGI